MSLQCSFFTPKRLIRVVVSSVIFRTLHNQMYARIKIINLKSLVWRNVVLITTQEFGVGVRE